MLVAEAMTSHPVSLPPTATAKKAAAAMRDNDIGDVLVVEKNGQLRGIVTDRDLVVRVAAEGKTTSKLADVCSGDMWTVGPMDGLEQAVETMREHAVRRLPVIDENEKVIGVISFGDVARHMDEKSAIARISQAQPNH